MSTEPVELVRRRLRDRGRVSQGRLSRVEVALVGLRELPDRDLVLRVLDRPPLRRYPVGDRGAEILFYGGYHARSSSVARQVGDASSPERCH